MDTDYELREAISACKGRPEILYRAGDLKPAETQTTFGNFIYFLAENLIPLSQEERKTLRQDTVFPNA